MSCPEADSRNFVFLDRDGVLNVDRTDYIRSWRDFQFYPDALSAMQLLRERKVHPVVVSNQSGLHRGLIEWEDFWDIHARMVNGVREAGGEVLAVFYCPHRPDEECSCRKPSPAMIHAASDLYGIPLHATCFIGDRSTDIEAAVRAGCRPVLLDRPGGICQTPRDGFKENNVMRYGSLMEAVVELDRDGFW